MHTKFMQRHNNHNNDDHNTGNHNCSWLDRVVLCNQQYYQTICTPSVHPEWPSRQQTQPQPLCIMLCLLLLLLHGRPGRQGPLQAYSPAAPLRQLPCPGHSRSCQPLLVRSQCMCLGILPPGLQLPHSFLPALQHTRGAQAALRNLASMGLQCSSQLPLNAHHGMVPRLLPARLQLAHGTLPPLAEQGSPTPALSYSRGCSGCSSCQLLLRALPRYSQGPCLACLQLLHGTRAALQEACSPVTPLQQSGSVGGSCCTHLLLLGLPCLGCRLLLLLQELSYSLLPPLQEASSAVSALFELFSMCICRCVHLLLQQLLHLCAPTRHLTHRPLPAQQKARGTLPAPLHLRSMCGSCCCQLALLCLPCYSLAVGLPLQQLLDSCLPAPQEPAGSVSALLQPGGVGGHGSGELLVLHQPGAGLGQLLVSQQLLHSFLSALQEE
mmetsp:Transcript_20293/g.44323  ORF Transcript_20293/g.44323 Transcript_20293/m.44323 type:complete len:438 (-) Transcript_20293:631-1944(-)